MEIILKEALPEKVPLLLHTAVLIGTATNRGEDFDIYLGLDNGMATKLKMLSLNQGDEALQENTSDLERFGKGSYEDWYSKGRTPFALVHRSSGALAAFVWFGPKELGRKSMKHLSDEERKDEYKESGGDWHTIAFRSYPPFRGTGVMTDFVKSATDIYMKYFPNAKLWTFNSRSNPASVALSEKLGYKIDESLSDATTVTMIKQ
jgi:hypothetical protein